MKLPSLWPVDCFAGGILLSSKLAGRLYLTPRLFLLVAASLLISGFVLLYKKWLLPAGIVAAAAWLCLGGAAAGLERNSIRTNLASSLIDAGKLDSSVALRWRGREIASKFLFALYRCAISVIPAASTSADTSRSRAFICRARSATISF